MRIEDSDISVDGFGRGAEVYFLSHFHSDHMSGLRKGWNAGPLWCSPVTARLLRDAYHLNGEQVTTIEAGEVRRLSIGGETVEVTAADANHCPGALMFHFRWPGRSVLYTGDFRLDDGVREAAQAFAGVDLAYVDGTYDDPQYRFPAQDETIAQVLKLVEANIRKEVFLAIYNVGKTRILDAVVKRFERPVYVSDNVRRLYRAMGLDHLVTDNPKATNLRAYSRGYFGRYFRWRDVRHRRTHAVIIPTGWAATRGRDRNGYVYVPYSEHCDYRELCDFRALLRAARTITI